MRVLILEDDPFIAFDLQSVIEGDGHEVVGVCASVAEAAEHLSGAVDYALLDIDVIDGKSFAIAAELKGRGIPFAFVSASNPSDVPRHLRTASFIPKPFEEQLVLDSLVQQPLA
jgi:DNA-binding response OmpR family regulator